MNDILELDRLAKKEALSLRNSENNLIEILQKIDLKKGFRYLGFSSMHDYCVKGLGLS